MATPTDLHARPGEHELEVSVFGPGFGESIVLHLGNNNWIIVDSCVDESGRPAAVQYLKDLGVSPSAAVKQVIATHWHDDHIRGMADTVSACCTADFLCAAGLNRKEFLTLTRLYKDAPIPFANGVSEFEKVLDTLKARPTHLPHKPRLVGQDRILWAAELNVASAILRVELRSLSPTDGAVEKGYSDIAKCFKQLLDGQLKAVRPLSPNHLAIVLWLTIGNVSVLLGSDLEESTAEGMGWSAIVACAMRPTGRARFFKVPHHGSETSHCNDVWTTMVESGGIASLTPFQWGASDLPTAGDISRIRGYTDKGYITAGRRAVRPTKRSPKVQTMINATAKLLYKHDAPIGHVRYRVNPVEPSSETIELFQGAQSLADMA